MRALRLASENAPCRSSARRGAFWLDARPLFVCFTLACTSPVEPVEPVVAVDGEPTTGATEVVPSSPFCEALSGVWTTFSRSRSLRSRHPDLGSEAPFDHFVLDCRSIRVPVASQARACPTSTGIVWGSDCTVYCETGVSFSPSTGEVKPHDSWAESDRLIVRNDREVLYVIEDETFLFVRCNASEQACRDVARRSREVGRACY